MVLYGCRAGAVLTGSVRTGLDQIDKLRSVFNEPFGVLCNQASINRSGTHILDLLRHEPNLTTIFGPQHGLWGHTQDNMIEWEGEESGGVKTYSLYGYVRKPTPEMLQGIRTLVIDLFDIGSRYYTFAWTLCLCLEACAEAGISVVVLDRPNPLGGVIVEGAVQDPEFYSFVGLKPLPIRHGLTIGEIARKFCPSDLDLEVIGNEGWNREMHHPDCGLLWALPSPNMPSYDTALVYPGGCLLEGTNLSEGRGTTKPFEQFGAPYLRKHHLADSLNDRELPGVIFRPVEFQPTFHKHGGQICEGCYVHVTDRSSFRPVQTYVEVITACYSQFLDADEPNGTFLSSTSGAGAWTKEAAEELTGFWKLPPYEYEFDKMPIDILWGSSEFRCRLTK